MKILLRANFDQANLKIDLNSQLWNKNITSVTSSGKNCLVSKNTFLKKVNVHLQTNVLEVSGSMFNERVAYSLFTYSMLEEGSCYVGLYLVCSKRD